MDWLMTLLLIRRGDLRRAHDGETHHWESLKLDLDQSSYSPYAIHVKEMFDTSNLAVSCGATVFMRLNHRPTSHS